MQIILQGTSLQVVVSFPSLHRIWSRARSTAGTLFTNLVAVSSYIGTRALFDIRVHGLHNFSVSPSTIIAISHKRDLDEIIIPSTLHFRKTLFRPRLRMWFATRDDAFDRGFLSTHFRLPRLLGRPMYTINLSPVMAAFRAKPISRLSGIRVGKIVRDVYTCEGNVALKDVLNAQWITKLASLLPSPVNSNLNDTRLRDFLSYDYRVLHVQEGDLSMLKSHVLERIRPLLLDKVNSQLNCFSNILNEGGILFFTPEDEHSPDGRFGPIRSGLHRVIRTAQADVRILPINITYDFVTVGRMRIHITIGPEITNLKGLTNNEFETLVQIVITKLGVINMGQLASCYLLRMAHENSEVITKELVAKEVLSQAQKLRSLGLSVDDSLVDQGAFAKRLDKFIKYCLRKHWLRAGTDGRLIVNKEAVLNSCQSCYRDHPIRYSYNELMTHLSAYGIEEPQVGS